jgi:hypothetical protein
MRRARSRSRRSRMPRVRVIVRIRQMLADQRVQTGHKANPSGNLLRAKTVPASSTSSTSWWSWAQSSPTNNTACASSDKSHTLPSSAEETPSDLMASAHQRWGTSSQQRSPSPHDQRAHGLPPDLERSDEWSADPPAATGTEPPSSPERPARTHEMSKSRADWQQGGGLAWRR